MNFTEAKENNQTDSPKEEQFVETVKDNNDVTTDSKIENRNNEEAAMADKNDERQNVKDFDHGKSAGDDQSLKTKTKTNGTEEAGDIKPNRDEIEKAIQEELGPNVTLDPQDEEHLDLNIMKDPVAISKSSVPTDNDEGEFLGDTDAVSELRAFIEVNKDKEGDDLKDDELLKAGTEVASRFNKKLSHKEMRTLAVLTKYNLLYGRALIILKDAVKETGQNWIYYYKQHFIPSTYSSTIKYMKLAKIPNVIRYSFFGMQRLEKIYTAIKDDYDMDEGDPIGEFLKENSINIDLHDDQIENFKYEIDSAIAKTRVDKFFNDENKDLPEDKVVKNTIDPDLVDQVIRKDKKIQEGLMKNLYLFAKGGSDPNVLLEDEIKGAASKSAKKNKTKLTDIQTIEGFPKIISELRSKVAYLTKNKALREKVTPKHIADLQAEVTALRKLISPKSK